MTKFKTSFFCQNCGAQFPKWIGKCNSCNEWNTIVEEVIQKEAQGSGRNWKQSNSVKRISKALKITEITASNEERLPTNNNELNRVLGGGPGKRICSFIGRRARNWKINFTFADCTFDEK